MALFPSQAPESHGSSPLKRRGLGDQVYECIKARIMDMEVIPGAHLNMEHMARELGTSPIPVREAMARLAAEGLLKWEPFRGYTVTPCLSPEQFRSLFTARRLIEGYAAFHGAALGLRDEINEMEHLQQIMETHPLGDRYMDYRTFSNADAKLHLIIVRSCQNPWLVDMYRVLNAHLHLSRLYASLRETERDFSEATAEHARIIGAYRRENGAEAREAVLEHLTRAEARLAPGTQHS